MRTDEILNTGATSASFGSVKAQKVREQLTEQKVERRNALRPSGEIVLGEIQKEIDEVRNIDYLNIEAMLTDEHVRSELMARKKYVEALVRLKNRFDNLLRDPNRKEGEDE